MSFGDFSQIPESLCSRSQWMPLTKVNGTGKRAYNREKKEEKYEEMKKFADKMRIERNSYLIQKETLEEEIEVLKNENRNNTNK